MNCQQKALTTSWLRGHQPLRQNSSKNPVVRFSLFYSFLLGTKLIGSLQYVPMAHNILLRFSAYTNFEPQPTLGLRPCRMHAIISPCLACISFTLVRLQNLGLPEGQAYTF